MNAVLLELYRHKTWATLRLIEYCQGLDDALLDATIPGTYGTIRLTLHHLVEAEEWYFWIVTRERLAEHLSDGPTPLSELAERIRNLAPQWEILLQDEDLPPREVATEDGWRQPASIVMAQAIHHADDHRSHVLSILGARGVESPQLDVWGYANSTGQSR
jgi:uncharacterized damage-inducible protein DinB